MSANEIIAILLSLGVGVSLGVLGSGGSIVMLPVLVYVASVDPQAAVGMSLAIVGGTSAFGAVTHYRKGHFHLQAAAFFSISGMVGAFFGSKLTHFVPSNVLMLLFAALMTAVGIAMLRWSPESRGESKCHPIRCLAVGACVGVLTGFLGVGGGFLIVPALVLFAGIETDKAVGSSLAIIAFNSVSGLLGHFQQTRFDLQVTFTLLAAALVGMFLGGFIAGRIPENTLRKSFAWFVLAVAIVIAAINLPI